MGARLIKANLAQANLSDCAIFGIVTQDLDLTGANQNNLVISSPDEPTITVDNLNIAQFVNSMLRKSDEVGHVIDNVPVKPVLILGRFSPDRQDILDTIRNVLRGRGLIPIFFDLERTTEKDCNCSGR